MKYEYGLLYPPDAQGKFRKRPMIEVELRGPNGTFRELALVDSGADRSLVHREIADVLALDDRQGTRHHVIGVSGITDVWYAEMTMRFAHAASPMTIPVGITSVGIVGVRIEVTTRLGTQIFDTPGRPIAMVSNLRVDTSPGR